MVRISPQQALEHADSFLLTANAEVNLGQCHVRGLVFRRLPQKILEPRDRRAGLPSRDENQREGAGGFAVVRAAAERVTGIPFRALHVAAAAKAKTAIVQRSRKSRLR